MPATILRNAANSVATARAGLAGIVAAGPKAVEFDVRLRLATEARQVIDAVERAQAAGYRLGQADSLAAIIVVRQAVSAMSAPAPASLTERSAEVVGFIDLLRPAIEVIYRRISDTAVRVRGPHE